MQIIRALDAAGCVACPIHGRKQQAHQQTDGRAGDEQLDDGEGRSARCKPYRRDETSLFIIQTPQVPSTIGRGGRQNANDSCRLNPIRKGEDNQIRLRQAVIVENRNTVQVVE